MEFPDAISGYTTLPVSKDETVLNHPQTKLSASVDGWIAEMLSHCDGLKDEATLADACGLNVEQVRTGLARLSELGFLVTEQMPKARFESLVTPLGEETLVYVPALSTAYNLNKAAWAVLERCDGQKSIEAVGQEVEAVLGCENGAAVVASALNELSNEGLVERQPFLSNRRKFLLTASKVAMVPLIMSVVAPEPARAASVCITGCVVNNGCAGCTGNCGALCGLADCSATNARCANFVMVISGNNVLAADVQRCANIITTTTFVNDCATGCGGGLTAFSCCLGSANNAVGQPCVFCSQNQGSLCLSGNCTGGVCV